MHPLPNTRPLNLLLASVLTLAVAQTPLAQTGSRQNLYQLEVIIFERMPQPPGADDEYWSKNLELRYPEPWRRLVDPEAEALRQAEREAAAQREAAFNLSDDFLQSLRNEHPGYAPAPSDEPTSATQTMPASPAAPAAPAGEPTTRSLAHYEYLPAERRTLTSARNSLQRSNQTRVLFHETWVQPLADTNRAQALVLHGGRQYGEHYELQGYLIPSLGRYLHIQTDLWLTQFAPNHGQNSEHWPMLPKMPDALSSAEKPHSPTVDNRPANDFSGSFTLSDGTWEAMDTYAELLTSPYLINQIVTMQQRRRMRSGEVHYLDHPRMGMLIKITPFRE